MSEQQKKGSDWFWYLLMALIAGFVWFFWAPIATMIEITTGLRFPGTAVPLETHQQWIEEEREERRKGS